MGANQAQCSAEKHLHTWDRQGLVGSLICASGDSAAMKMEAELAEADITSGVQGKPKVKNRDGRENEAPLFAFSKISIALPSVLRVH